MCLFYLCTNIDRPIVSVIFPGSQDVSGYVSRLPSGSASNADMRLSFSGLAHGLWVTLAVRVIQ